MGIDIPPGKNPPEDIYVVIEIPMGSNVKYEIDKESGMVFVDRVLFTSMVFPFNYGFIPGTLEEDGDPVDVVLLSHDPFVPGSVVRARPVALLEMEDENGPDSKVVAVPHEKIDNRFSGVKDVDDIDDAVKDRIKHFFEHYKELEKGKWVKVKEWKGRFAAEESIRRAVERFKSKSHA
ncbi:inorganic diphosphatase [Thermofilum pendens]|uniref:Inorganic pyrophosphatase n=1 Tax=Thermofilum pendens (strain DSM 2475 / Hrk 5) TaxID=368408 RepID=A1RWG6_THEPD|nr:inorganic diphosphatase [Thermofilum pendens]ABL77546.1 Inorganic diphosphatase [Thermofilum pendens Hrk 5]